MNKHQERYLREYIDECLVLLNMQNWTVRIEKRPADDGDVASVYMTEGQRRAYISIGESFWGDTPNEKPTRSVTS